MDNGQLIFDDVRKDARQISETENQHDGLENTNAPEPTLNDKSHQQENLSPLSPQDLKYLAEHLGCVIEQAFSKQAQSAQRGNNFENVVLKNMSTLYDGINRVLTGITNANSSSDKVYPIIPTLLKNQISAAEKLNSVTRELQSLRQAAEDQARIIANQAKVIEEQNSIIKKQHENIIRYENDVIYKTQKELIMELIGVADQLKYTLNDYAQEKDFDKLYNSIGDLAEWVDASLQVVAIRKYITPDSKEFNRKRQEMIETRETANSNEDGTIKSLLPGYIWSIPLVGSNVMQEEEERPRVYEFIIRPEQVVHLKYVKPTDSPEEGQIEQKQEKAQVENSSEMESPEGNDQDQRSDAPDSFNADEGKKMKIINRIWKKN